MTMIEMKEMQLDIDAELAHCKQINRVRNDRDLLQNNSSVSSIWRSLSSLIWFGLCLLSANRLFSSRILPERDFLWRRWINMVIEWIHISLSMSLWYNGERCICNSHIYCFLFIRSDARWCLLNVRAVVRHVFSQSLIKTSTDVSENYEKQDVFHQMVGCLDVNQHNGR